MNKAEQLVKLLIEKKYTVSFLRKVAQVEKWQQE